MSDLHIEMQSEQESLDYSWFDIVSSILSEAKFTNISAMQMPSPSDYEEYEFSQQSPDFTYHDHNEEKTAVELKIYRWRNDWLSHAAQAINHLQSIMQANGYKNGVLIITWDLSLSQDKIKALNLPSGIDIWDIKSLREITKHDGQLSQQLEDLIDETIMHDDTYSGFFAPTIPEPIPSSEIPNPGRNLSLKLKQSKAGKTDWQRFEILCEEAFKLLFGHDIKAWRSQNRTDDDLNRMDLIGRINVGTSSFWSVIEHDFRTRYVVFEAKNYTDKIKQGEVYTTEKYLFTTALRSVALMVARNGYDDGAYQAAVGALREQGKLILIITMEELCQMLEGFDEGDVPENVLYKKMDDLLMHVGR